MPFGVAGVHVAVCGGGEADEATCAQAEAVGRELARLGAVVVTGGLGGVMAAACRGAKAGGGATLAVLPGDDRRAANPWVDLAVPTGMGEARNAVVVRAADAVVAVSGEFGTLSEIALALRLGKPVVGVDTWQLSRRGAAVDAVHAVADPVAAARLAVELAQAILRSTTRERGSR